jgi:hypothetical protein
MNIFFVVYAVFLSCDIGFILPAHHHEDGQNHADCAACVVQDEPAEAGTVFCLVVFSMPVFAAVVREGSPCSRVFRAVYHSRAPPSAA